LAVFIGICLAVGASGSGITATNVHHWYLSLSPPPLTPPNWLFGPVWGVLYVLMGVAAWLIWRQADLFSQQRRALAAWGWQLGINALWVPVFFGLHLMVPALGVILVLAGAITLTIRKFWPLSRVAALLMLPYLAWAGFATYLNAGFWWLNH
jgi:tryptophan-rich sensory protein